MKNLSEFIVLLDVTKDPKDTLPLSEMYDAYFKWSVENKKRTLGKIIFANSIDELCIPRCTLGKNITGFRGVKLGDDLEWFID